MLCKGGVWWIVKELGKMKSCCLLMIWPQFCSRARWRSSFDSWARALAKLAVTNEFSSFALARRITMRCKYMGEWYSRRGHFVLALDPCLIYEINGGRQRNQPNFVPVNELMSIFEQIWETRKHILTWKNTHSVGYMKRNQISKPCMTLWLCTTVNSESVSPESDQS